MEIGSVFMIIFSILLIEPISATVIPIDNEVLNEPSIDCKVDSIVAQFRTRRPFYGRIFVKGHSANSECVIDFASRSFDNSLAHNATIRVQYGTCDVRRERSVSPRGVHMFSTIVVQFHNVFITKVDRSYRLSCFYKEAVQTVTNGLEVSVLTTANLIGNFDMPICSYSVRQETSNGPLVRYAKVGDRVVHRWECQSPGIESKDNPYGMLVHSCIVDDGRGNKVTVVDEQGCAIDPYILGHLTYNDNLLVAYREAHVFKFADQNTLAFSCQIRLCVKAVDACVGMTPPKCLPLKNKRSVGHGETISYGASGFMDLQFSVKDWDTVMDETGHYSQEKTVCFNGSDCYYCQYTSKTNRTISTSNQNVPVLQNWHCRPVLPTGFNHHHSIMLHSCSLSQSENEHMQLIDENGCEMNVPEIRDLEYGDDRSIGARGEIERSKFPRSLTCQLRLCLRAESKCHVKFSKCKKRIERSFGELALKIDDNDDLDVATDRLLVFDTDDLGGFSFNDLDTPIDEPLCLSHTSAIILFGSTILLLFAMLISCSALCIRSRRKSIDAQSAQSSTIEMDKKITDSRLDDFLKSR